MSRFQIILENIARKNGSSAEEVLREMQTAIDSAYAGRSDKSQQLWDSMSFMVRTRRRKSSYPRPRH